MADDKYSRNRQKVYDLLKGEGYTDDDLGGSADALFQDRGNATMAYQFLSGAGYSGLAKDQDDFNSLLYAPEGQAQPAQDAAPAPRRSESQQRTARFNEMVRQREAARGRTMGPETAEQEAAGRAEMEERMNAQRERIARAQKPAGPEENPFPYRGGLEEEEKELQTQLEEARGDSAFVDEYERRRKESMDRGIMSMGTNPFGTSPTSAEDKWLLENEERYARAKGDKAKAEEIEARIAEIQKARNAIEDREARAAVRAHRDPQSIIATGATPFGGDNAGGRFAKEMEVAEYSAADDLLAMAEQEYNKGSKLDPGYQGNAADKVGTAIAQFFQGGINNVDKGSLTMGLSEGAAFKKVRDVAEKNNELIDKAMSDLGYDDAKVGALMKSVEEKSGAFQTLVGELQATENELTAMEATLKDLAESGDEGKYRAYYNRYKKKYDAYAKRMRDEYEPLAKTFEEYGNFVDAIKAATEDGLTDGEKAVLDAFGRYTRAKSVSAKLESGASKSGAGAEQSMEFMLDFILTRGLGQAGTKTATKIAAKRLARELGEDAVKGMVVRPGLGLKMATDAVVSAGRTALMFPRNLAAYGEQITAMDREGSGVDNLGRYTFDRSRANAALNTALTQYIEYWSEGFGEYFGAGEQALFRQVTGRAPATAIGQTLKNYRGSIGKYLDYGKFDGMFNEMLEEVVGSTFNSLAGWMSGDRVGDKQAMKEFFAGDNLSTLFFSFLPMSAIGAVTNMKSYNRMMDRYNKGVETLNPLLATGAVSQKDLDDLTSRLSEMTPTEVKDKVVEITDKARKANGGALPKDFAQGLAGYLEGTFSQKLERDTWEDSAEKVSVANAYAQQYQNPDVRNAWGLARNEQLAMDAALEAGFTEEELSSDSAILAQQATALRELEPERSRVLLDYATAKAQADGLKDGYDSETEDDVYQFENDVRSNVYVNGSVTTADLGGQLVFITSDDADVNPDGTVSTPTGDGLVAYRESPNGEVKRAKASEFSEAQAVPLNAFLMDRKDKYTDYRNRAYEAARNTISAEGQIAEVNNHIGHTVYLRGSGAYEPITIERTTSNGANAVIRGDKEALKAVATASGIQSPGGTMLEVPIRNLYPLLAREDDGSLSTEMQQATPAAQPAQEPSQDASAQQQSPQDLLGTPQTIRVGNENREVFVTDVRQNGDVWFEYQGEDGRTKRSSLPAAEFFNAMQATQAPAAEAAAQEAAPVAEESQKPAPAPEPAQEEALAETDFRGNPIPMKDGQVDQESFRERDPEAWARWAESLPEGDERRPSLGTAKRLEGIAKSAKKAVDKAQKELEKLYDEGASDEKIQAKEKELRALTARQSLYDNAVANFSQPAPVREAAPVAEATPVQEEAPVQAEAPVAEAPAAEEPAPAQAPVAEAQAPAEEAQEVSAQARISQAPEEIVAGMDEEERQRPLKAKAGQWAKRTGVPAELIESADQVTNKAAREAILSGRRVTGWFDKDTGRVYIYLPNCASEREIDRTYIHEVIAHKGLPGLLGKRGWNALMDSVWRALGPAQQFRWIDYPSVRNMRNATLLQKQRTASDEFVAHLAENIDTNVSAWKRFVARLKEVLLRMGIKVNLTNEDLAALVGRSLARYERMTERGASEAAVKNEIASGVAGGVEVKGNEENQVQFSVTSIASGAGFSIVESDSKGNMVFVASDGRRFDGRTPITVEDVKGMPDTVMGYMMADAKRLGTITDAQEESIWSAYTGMLNYMLEKGLAENGGVNHVKALWEWEVQNTVYKSVAANSDAQYSYSLDITRVCKKNEATIKAIAAMQKRLGYGVTPGQIMDIYLSGIEEGYQVPCPVCYVFSRYINNGVVATIAINGQRKYSDKLVDPSTLTEPEKKRRIAYWVRELNKQAKANMDNAKAIASAKQDCARIIERINFLSDQITRGLIRGEERNAAEAEVRALDRRYRAALDVVSQSNLTQWIKQFAIHKVDGKWELWGDTFQGFPEEYALDLRLTADAIVRYPAIQRLRNSRGSAGGKEIHFASNNDIGDVPMMLGASDLRNAQNYYQLAAGEYDPAQRAEYLKNAAKRFADAHRYAQQQSLRGGQRMWSWSDNIERLAPDVFMNLMQIQMLGGALQSYSKQLEGVNLVASMGGYVNGSLMGKGRGYEELTDDQIEVVDGREVLKEDITDTVVVHSPQGDTERTRVLAPAGSPVYDNNGQKVVLVFDDVVGIDAYGKTGPDGQHLKGLFDLNGELDKAGNILVGMNDIHVRAAMADPRVFFIIPWHASGNSVHILQQMLGYLGVESEVKDFTDYTNVQEEQDLIKEEAIDPNIVAFWEAHKNETDFPVGVEGGIPSGSPEGGLSEQQRHYRELRNAIFTDPNLEQNEAWMAEIMADAFLSQVYAHVRNDVDAQKMTNGDTKFIYPYEYWNEHGTYDTADENGARYIEYCRRMGYKPKFVGKLDGKPAGDFGNFSEDPGYWKLLIDRRMYDVRGQFQGLTPTTTDGFTPNMVDPEWTGQVFEVTKVADDPGAETIAQRTIDRENANMPGGVPVVNYGITLDKAVKKYEDVRNEGDTMFRIAEEPAAPVFYSNAAVALSRIKMDKATPEQWVKMLEKEGGLKAGEDKWIGLGDWLRSSNRKSITKQEVADYIAQNQIVIEEQDYAENIDLTKAAQDNVRDTIGRGKELDDLQSEIDGLVASEEYRNLPDDEAKDDWLLDQMKERYGDDFELGYFIDENQKIDYNIEPWDIDEESINESLGVRKINQTRLMYTTDGLENKREIALVVPNIEPWNQGDTIHFGDAGEGRAVAWVRFGETTTYNPEAPAAQEAHNAARKDLDEYRDKLKAKYADSDQPYFKACTPEELAELASLKDREVERYDELQALLENRPRVLVIDEIQSKRHQEAREQGGYRDDTLVKKARERAEAAKAEYDRYTQSLIDKYGGFNEMHDRLTPEENAESQRLYMAFRDANQVVARKGFDPNEDEEYRRLRAEQQAHENSPEFQQLMKDWAAAVKAGDADRTAEIQLQLNPYQLENQRLIHKIEDREVELADEFNETHGSKVAAAPFEKNWHELAMKRMLRLAAEEGYDYVAWTTGDQQAERYNIGGIVDKIDIKPGNKEGVKDVSVTMKTGPDMGFDVDENGKVLAATDPAFVGGKNLSDYLGKELAVKVLSSDPGTTIDGDNLRVGGEGMKGFYDEILPRFMNKYGKKWGVKVSDITLPLVEKEGETMHAVPVTDEMVESVMEGQTMFRISPDSQRLFDAAKERFGTTRDIREAGYVLPDGTMLDFSGRHWTSGGDNSWLNGMRQVDHREISDLEFERDGNTPTGIETDMSDFIRRGAIRISYPGAINLYTKPTAAQRSVLARLISSDNRFVRVDFGDGSRSDHYADYDRARPDRILYDIDSYFDDGIKPEGQTLFRVDSDGESETLFRIREGEAPKKTQKVYKLMRLENGKLYPLFIDRDAEAIEIGTWYDADSPDLAFLKKMPAGVFLVDAQNGTYTSLEDYKRKRGEKVGKLPSKADVEEASKNGLRWMKITETDRAQRRYDGENRKYENIGINGSEGVSTFAMRPGWHAGSLPTMRQIGKGSEKNLRDDKFVWVEGEISADKDYNEEAQGNPDKDIPTHIPTDGFYMKATNANKKASQADRVGWYVAGAFKPNRIISDSEARQVIDSWNAEHPDAPVEYDWPRESGREFNAETMRLDGPAAVESLISSEEREDAKDFVGTLFDDAVSGAWRGRPMTVGRLTGEGKAYLESLSGGKMKDVVDFVLNPSDLVHIYGDHFGENEKDKGSNIPLTREDIKNIIDVIERPDRVIYLGNDGNSGSKFAFLKKSDGGAYNLIEVYGDRRGNLTAKTFYNTKRGVSQRAMILEKESPNSTSKTSGATSFDGANVPILFDIRNNSGNLYRESTPERRSIEDAERKATEATLDRMSEELGVMINRVTRDEMPAGHKTDKGYYNPSTGEMTICMDNVTDERDAIATVFHETVAHKGLRDLFGPRFREAMVNIYASLDAKGREWVNGYIRRHGLNFGDEGIVRGVEEYMAHLAESGDFKDTVWDRIKEIVGKIVDAVFGTNGFVFTDRELNYILRASYEHLKDPNFMNTTAGKAWDTLLKRQLGINETDPNRPTDPDGPGTGILFRDGDTGVASEDYNAEMELWHNVAVMENQNADLPVKVGMDKVMKEVGMSALSEDEDYLMRHNLSSSRAETEAHNFELFYFTPLLEQVRAIQSRLLGARANKSDRQQAYERILDYLYAVSALERNEYKRNETGEDRDFSGITSLMGRPVEEWQEAEDDARAMIDAFRAEVNDDAELDELWDRIRACTDFSLEHAYKHGLLTRDEYEKLHGTDTKPRMWNFYLPLRGFSEKTAEEEFSYSSFFGMSSQNPVVKKMKGRWTKADNPLANILNIAENEIVQGNDNWARQALYNFVLDAGDNSLLTEVEPWFVKDPANNTWSLAEPNQGESLEDFEARMDALRSNQPPLSKKGRRGLKLDNIMASKAHRNEHMIRLKVGGVDKMIWVNGNPAFAKAVNGFRRSQSAQWLRRASRALSNLFTTYSLDFTAKNLIRDTIYSRSALIVKEDKAYRHRFAKNWWSNFGYGAFAFPMARLAFQWESGELQRKPEAERTKREQMFIDFMTDGGQTGYTIINSVNEIKRSLERSMRRAGQETGPVTIPILGHYAKFVKTLNEAFELLTRFTAYETSRDMGRSGERSASDAKEISVNFNRRGAQSGEGIWGNIASYLGATHYFYNAGIQGFDNYLRLYKAGPVKMTTITTGLLMMGILTPMINSMLAGAAAGAGGSGDDDWYWNLPEWVRRNNLILGTGRWYLAIPLPVEFRAPYGMGDIIGSAFVYEKTPNRTFGGVAGDLISTASGLLPVNPIEGYTSNGNIGDAALRAVVPDATVFFVDWATNRDYTGRPLWKENPFNDTVPRSQGVYASTPKGLVFACQKLAEVTDGAIDVPPGLVRDFMNNYGGGFFRAAEDMSKILFTDEERPFRWDNVPFFSGFTGHIDEDRSNSFATSALNEYKDLSDGIVKKMNAINGTDEITAAMVYGEPEDIPEQYRSKVRVQKILSGKDYQLGKMYRDGMNNKYKMKQYVKGEKKGQWYKSKEIEQKGVNTLKKEWKDLREQWASMPNKTPEEKSAKAEMGLMVQDAWHRYYDAEANLAEQLMNYEYGK